MNEIDEMPNWLKFFERKRLCIDLEQLSFSISRIISGKIEIEC